ncbi:MAG: hypothetical protein LBS59_05225 [Puniceicoccales bacterium]|jgi:hypothetical protein|nr:hypothetical protein [Puniceicoccales bacterium]
MPNPSDVDVIEYPSMLTRKAWQDFKAKETKTSGKPVPESDLGPALGALEKAFSVDWRIYSASAIRDERALMNAKSIWTAIWAKVQKAAKEVAGDAAYLKKQDISDGTKVRLKEITSELTVFLKQVSTFDPKVNAPGIMAMHADEQSDNLESTWNALQALVRDVGPIPRSIDHIKFDQLANIGGNVNVTLVSKSSNFMVAVAAALKRGQKADKTVVKELAVLARGLPDLYKKTKEAREKYRFAKEAYLEGIRALLTLDKPF